MNTAPKPRPETDALHIARFCSKCNGTGFYCMGMVNGHPYSQTGFTCYRCNGRGWIIARKPVKKALCPRCNLRMPVDQPHYIQRKQADGSWAPVECK